mgnify:CR=1 FL=1
MFWAFFYYFQNLAKSLGRFSLILDPFFERFPLSNTQKAQKFSPAAGFLSDPADSGTRGGGLRGGGLLPQLGLILLS